MSSRMVGFAFIGNGVSDATVLTDNIMSSVSSANGTTTAGSMVFAQGISTGNVLLDISIAGITEPDAFSSEIFQPFIIGAFSSGTMSAGTTNVNVLKASGTASNTSIELLPTVVATPTLTVSETALAGFTYVDGSGPSTSQTFTVSGDDLTAQAVVSAVGGNYEVSEDDISYSTTVNLSQTSGNIDGEPVTIYVRLKTGLSVATYNSDTVSITSTGATTKTVTLAGEVTAAPSLSVSTPTLTGFTYAEGSGPSTPGKNFTVSGTDLSTDAIVTGTTDYEVSKTSSTTGFEAFVTLTETAGTITAASVWVRLKAGRSKGSYNSQFVNITSTGATTQTVTVSGEVTVNPAQGSFMYIF